VYPIHNVTLPIKGTSNPLSLLVPLCRVESGQASYVTSNLEMNTPGLIFLKAKSII